MNIKQTNRQQKIVALIASQKQLSISQIKEQLQASISQVTLNRDLAKLVKSKFLNKTGKARAITYSVSDYYTLFSDIDIEAYFTKGPDQRNASRTFNFDLFSLLESTEILTIDEKNLLESLRKEYQKNTSTISPTLYKKEMERLTIELSWKSAQIEGNTYSLLETEKLFLERESAKNKPKEEATMLLNHKDALNFLLENTDLAKNLTIRVIEEVHSLLIKNLDVGKNIRSRAVGIIGTAYKPLDNEFQIKEFLVKMCDLINSKENSFEKALLAIVLISYIQPFEDGNKRTGRMIGNALLINAGTCPLSFRSVDSVDYKKAILLFYEQNNLMVFKQLFIEQNVFGVENYFR